MSTAALCTLSLLLLLTPGAESSALQPGGPQATHARMHKLMATVPRLTFISSSASVLGRIARPVALCVFGCRPVLGGRVGGVGMPGGQPAGLSVSLRAMSEGGTEKVQTPPKAQAAAPAAGQVAKAPPLAVNPASLINGIIGVNKPSNWTSFDVVAKVRSTLGKHIREQNPQLTYKQCRIKVGHGGTLDPAATGVLVVGIGRGTKLMDLYTKGSKSYKAVGFFGFETDTCDAEGQQTGESKGHEHITQAKIEEVLKRFEGDIMQVPPQYSALKIAGQRAYKLAREGIQVEMVARKVVIHSITMSRPYEETCPAFEFEVSCGGGTYIRSLVRDIGRELGSAAHMQSLQRVKQGEFALEDCLADTDIFDAEVILEELPKSTARLEMKV